MRAIIILTAVLVSTGTLLVGAQDKTNQPLSAPQPTSWKYTARQLSMPDGKLIDSVPTAQKALYKIVDDDKAEGGKALQVRADTQVLFSNAVLVARTPSLTVPPGLYRVKARMKLSGMVGVIGTGIRFTSEPQANRFYEYTLHGYHFKEADAWQEFSYVTEVTESDVVTKRPRRASSEGGIWTGAKTNLEAIVKRPITPILRADLGRKPGDPEPSKATEPLYCEISLLPTKTIPGGANSKDLFGGVANSMQSLTVDNILIERLPDPTTLTVRQVLPQKIWLRPGEQQVFHVWLGNRSGKKQTAQLHLKIVYGLDSAIEVAKQDVTLDNGQYDVLQVPWTPQPGKDLWGCEVVAEIVVDGKAVSSANEFLSVHNNPWAVLNYGGASRNRNPYHGIIDYKNYVEFFGISAGDGIKPFPDDPSLPYYSGMGSYYTHMDFQKASAAWNRALGLSTFLYIWPGATSDHAEKMYQKHPEWFENRLDWTDLATEQWQTKSAELVRKFQSGEAGVTNMPGLYHTEGVLNFHYDGAFQNMLDGAAKAIEYVGFDGIRWDGSLKVGSVNALGETVCKPEEAVAETDKRLRQWKTEMRKRFPKYTEGSNGIAYQPALTSRKVALPPIEKAPTMTAFLFDGSDMMDEGWMNAYQRRDPRNVIADYYWICRREADYCRKAGGFVHTFAPQRDANPYFKQSTIYYNLLVLLAGAQYPGQWSCTPGSDTGPAQFATRFSEFMWDPKLMWLENADKVVRVNASADLWYADGVVWRDLPDGKRRYVIPIINPPTSERFYREDRYSELPEPIREPFSVKVNMPAGFSKAKAWMLSAEPETSITSLETKVSGDAATFKVPELIIYRVAVVEFEK